MYTFFDSQGRVFTSPNRMDPPPTIILDRASDVDDLVMNIGKMRLMSSRHPHLPYAPRRLLRTGTLFSCLHYYSHIPIVPSNESFSIHADLVAKWLELDRLLTQVFKALPVSCPPNVILRPVPSDARYAATFPTEQEARTAGMRALRAFQHFITLCSWAMASNAGNNFDNPAWVQVLLSKGISPTLVEMLRTSELPRFSSYDPRVGTVVDVTDEACLPYVRRMVNAQVPVYIYWGTHDLRHSKLTFKRVAERVSDAQWINEYCFPSEAALKDVIDVSGNSSTSNVATGPYRVPPPPVKGSGQSRGESWKEFFARRAATHASILAGESPAARRSREQRVNAASAGRMPGRKGANVFQWEEKNGFRIRTPIGYKFYMELWGDYYGGQRRYDPFADEWDLCTEFDSDAKAECSDDDSDDDPPIAMRSREKSAPPSTLEQPSIAVPEKPSYQPPPLNTLVDSQSSPSRQEMLCDAPQEGPELSTGNQASAGPSQPEAELPASDRPMACDPQPVVVPPSLDQRMVCDLQPAVVPPPIDHPIASDLEPESQISSGGQEHPSNDAPRNEQPMSVDGIPESDTPSGNGSVPSDSLPDPQESVNACSASVLIGDDIPESQSPPTMHFRDVLENCYGFTYIPSTAVVPQTDASLKILARKICEGGSSLPDEKSLRMAATAFLEKLTMAQPLDPLDDMADNSLLDQYTLGHLTVQRHEGRHIAIDGTRTIKTFYQIISRAAPSPRFAVFLDDPSSVLYLIRTQPGSELSDVVVELVRRGLPVSTRVLRDTAPTSNFTVSRGLGSLPFRYRPRPSDYVAYLQRRDDLLRRTYGRAALLKGGIIGRLARESLDERADFIVASGPSEDAERFGSCIEIEGSRYWDDDLDCTDEDIICGLYKISTGNCLPVPHHYSMLTYS